LTYNSKHEDLALSKEVPDQTFRNIDFVRRASVVEAEKIFKDCSKVISIENIMENEYDE